MPTETISKIEAAQAVAEQRDRVPRHVPLSGVEVRAKDEGGFSFRGTAAVFDQLSDDLGGFREQIKRGAFKKVLDDDVRLLYNHDPNYVLARNGSGTLKLTEEPRGLVAEADIPDLSYARDIAVLLERGDVSQMSFAFRLDYHDDGAQAWEEADGEVIRTISRFSELFDVSIVTYPAYPQTDAGVRAMDKLRRGEDLADDEREALLSQFDPSSTDEPTEEREVRAEALEPDPQASEEQGPVAEDEDTSGGLSGRSARVRVRAHEARL